MESTQADLVPVEPRDDAVDRGLVVALDLVAVHGHPAQNPVTVYLSGLRPNSKRAMRAALNRVAAELVGSMGDGRQRRPRIAFDQIPWHELRFQHVQALRARLGEQYSPSAANQSLVAIREVPEPEDRHLGRRAGGAEPNRPVRARRLRLGRERRDLPAAAEAPRRRRRSAAARPHHQAAVPASAEEALSERPDARPAHGHRQPPASSSIIRPGLSDLPWSHET